MKTYVSFSGGLDSTSLASRYRALGDDLVLVSFDYGQRHGSRELGAAAVIAHALGAEHRVVNLKSLTGMLTGSALTDWSVDVPDGHYEAESMRLTVVPNRNAIMANIVIGAASAAGADTVALGVHAGDHAVYPDCRPAFIDALRGCAETALEGFKVPVIETPFLYWSKAQIVADAVKTGAPLYLSWSCYKGGLLHCGTCGTCTERKEAFVLAGVEDPTEYEW